MKKSLRLDGYVRVSHVGRRAGESYISPKVQEDAINGWARLHGHDIIAVHVEENVSGGKMDRPLLNEVMRRIDAGETEGVVVYKLDRFARTLKGVTELVERINEHEALFASVSEGFDLTTDAGRLMFNIMLSFAQFERERIQGNWRSARAEAISRNVHLSPWVPFGYRRADTPMNPATGRPEPAPLEPDPDTAPILRDIFERRAAGQSWGSIRDRLNDLGVRSTRGVTWSHSALVKLIGNDVYLGTASGAFAGGSAKRGAHPALVSEATWHAAQTRRTARASGDTPSIVRGLARCASCRYTMAQTAARSRGDVTYRCGRKQNVGDCPAPAGIMAIPTNGHLGLDDFVTEEMFKRLAERDEPIRFEGVDLSAEDARADAQAAEERLAAAAEDTELQQAMGRSAYLMHMTALRQEAETLAAELNELLRRTGGPRMPVAELREKWYSGEMTIAEKRDRLAQLIRYIFVRPRTDDWHPSKATSDDSRRDYLAGRVRIVWTDEPDIDVPRQGRHGFVPRPFTDFPDADPHDPGVAVA